MPAMQKMMMKETERLMTARRRRRGLAPLLRQLLAVLRGQLVLLARTAGAEYQGHDAEDTERREADAGGQQELLVHHPREPFSLFAAGASGGMGLRLMSAAW